MKVDKKDGDSKPIGDFDVETDASAIRQSVLLQIAFDRIILDEAHVIRNPKTGISQAVCRLRAVRRWAVSGTPVQNKELDMYSLLRFLRVSPFDQLAVYIFLFHFLFAELCYVISLLPSRCGSDGSILQRPRMSKLKDGFSF